LIEKDNKKSASIPIIVERLNSNMLISNSIRGQVLQALSVIRLRPFDTSTIEGRANERLRRVFWTATTSALAKGINTLAILVSVPITLDYLGTERYGLWMAITAIVAFLGFADLGIGNVILNLVSEASGKNDVEAARKCISNAFFMLIWISVGLAFLFVLIYPYVGWDQFFNVSSSIARKEAGPAVATFLACFLVNLPLSIIPRIQMGYQEGYLSSIWQGISNLLGLAGLVAIVHLKAGLPWLVLVITGSPALGNLLNGISLFAFQRPWLIPRRHDLSALIAKQIVWVGFLFLILQVTNAITYSADNVIIARVLGPEAVTNYAVPSKLFIIAPNILYMFLAPLWPAYGEASARGDDSWAKKTLGKAILATFVLCSLSALFLLAFGEKILQVWTGSRVMFSLSLMIGLGAWTTLSSVVTALGLFLNAINKIGFQTMFALLTAFFATLTKVILAGSVGLPGVVWGQFAVSAFLMLIPYTIYLKKRFAK
jgi:O-antigen/teichoic acid export membrane protein